MKKRKKKDDGWHTVTFYKWNGGTYWGIDGCEATEEQIRELGIIPTEDGGFMTGDVFVPYAKKPNQ